LELLTGLNLGESLYFALQIEGGIVSIRPDTFVARGDLIGPDSCGYPVEIIWKEGRGKPVCAAWTSLPIPELVDRYAVVRPKEIPMSGLPFPITWGPWWDTNLPDVMIEINCEQVPTVQIINQLKDNIGRVVSGYKAIARRGKKLLCYMDIGFQKPVRPQIRQILKAVALLHKDCHVEHVDFGLSNKR
jgi:hypothetical protein